MLAMALFIHALGTWHWGNIQYESEESENDTVCSLKVHLSDLLRFVWIGYGCPWSWHLWLCFLLLLWLGSSSSAGLASDVGQRGEDLAALHDDGRMTNWRGQMGLKGYSNGSMGLKERQNPCGRK
jgi:hypothetical protein